MLGLAAVDSGEHGLDEAAVAERAEDVLHGGGGGAGAVCEGFAGGFVGGDAVAFAGGFGERDEDESLELGEVERGVVEDFSDDAAAHGATVLDVGWWLDHGLDGLVGGVVGGMATGVAVGVTLHLERRGTRQAAVLERISPLREVLADLGEHLTLLVPKSAVHEPRATVDDAEWLDEFKRMYRRVRTVGKEVEALTARDWPEFSLLAGITTQAVWKSAEQGLAVRDPRPMTRTAIDSCEWLLDDWMREPNRYESFWTRFRRLKWGNPGGPLPLRVRLQGWWRERNREEKAE